MKVKSIGIIGAGKHFVEKIYPIISKNSSLKIDGILRKSNKNFKGFSILKEKEFLKRLSILFIFVAQIIFMKNTY